MVKTLIIAGTHSGVGKTTLTVGLCAALRARGLTVQPFKVGPDYIDPSHLTLAAGRPCRNLDSWMMPPERTRELFERVARDADIAVIEGVMGLFDGFGYDDDSGSTAQVAKLIGAPVLVVLDAAKVARSAAAIAKGFQEFDPRVAIAGFVVNRVAGESHGLGVAGAIAKATGQPVLGWLPRDPSIAVPERHLGLIPSAEPGDWPLWIEKAARFVEQHLNVAEVLSLARKFKSPSAKVTSPVAKASAKRKRVIAVARDEAFHFCYPENLELLEEAGARLAFFSPLGDAELPDGTAGVLLSGGFPEVYAAELSANVPMHRALRQAHADRLPIYAECGGLMLLTEAIVDFAGRAYPMAGLLEGHSEMTRSVTLGYRQARAVKSSWLLRKDEIVRGHEFHYSIWRNRPEALPAAYEIVPQPGRGESRFEGAQLGNLWASYVHLHFWGKPELARRFVAAMVGSDAAAERAGSAPLARRG